MYFQIVLFFQTWNILQHFERTVRGVLTGALEKFVSIRITLGRKKANQKEKRTFPSIGIIREKQGNTEERRTAFLQPSAYKKTPNFISDSFKRITHSTTLLEQ